MAGFLFVPHAFQDIANCGSRKKNTIFLHMNRISSCELVRKLTCSILSHFSCPLSARLTAVAQKMFKLSFLFLFFIFTSEWNFEGLQLQNGAVIKGFTLSRLIGHWQWGPSCCGREKRHIALISAPLLCFCLFLWVCWFILKAFSRVAALAFTYSKAHSKTAWDYLYLTRLCHVAPRVLYHEVSHPLLLPYCKSHQCWGNC